MARVAPLLGFLGLWYAFNATFNVQNKVILNRPVPVGVWVQLASGILFFVPAWLTLDLPNVDTKLILRFCPLLLYTAAATAAGLEHGRRAVFFRM